MTLKETPFLDTSRWVMDTELSFAVYDGYPVSKGHMLILPKRVVADYFDLTEDERRACWSLVVFMKGFLEEKYHPEGFNIGINVGEVAGQTVGHVHIHLIPRYKGDHPKPRGGVRAVIPEKADY